MRSLLRASILALAAGMAFAAPAIAQSPHFVGTPSCSKSLTSGLTCSGKAAGLGNRRTTKSSSNRAPERTNAPRDNCHKLVTKC